MPQSISNILVHIVFSTKNRQPFLRDDSFRKEMHAVMAEEYKKLSCPALVVGGPEDHVHILSRLHSMEKAGELIGETKRQTSLWAKDAEGPEDFYWQSGYGAFSVGQMEIDLVHRYIRRQPQKHETMSFKEEFINFLDKYDIDYDEQYVWD